MTDEDYQLWRDEISVAGFKALVTERDEALRYLAEWGHKIAGSAGMVPDRLVVADATNYWWKQVQPFLKRLGWFDRPAGEGGEKP
jgi:hypothetical protein